ncbi:type II toxin-antitoxin system VapC family toxin [Thermococcus thermotolerans]|uniref:type II toxin-antitoxin system VapC family toxin n=1 Tax=Thermococcus thermotolerans TaxID=2969672 RepID=UPI002158034D|nr:type II toxin-antitoxin system VapC family toxin [Thermococcus thermotolerans]
MRSFMVDSTIIVEHLKGNEAAKRIIETLVESEVDAYINGTVASEVIFIYLKMKTGRSYITLKRKPDLVKSLNKQPIYDLLRMFKFAETNEFIFSTAERLIDTYGLLPNDSIILATAIFYGFDYLITFDSDFLKAASHEGIKIISSEKELERALEG